MQVIILTLLRQIIWNKKAVTCFDEIIEYLEENVSELAAEKFFKQLYDVIEKINRYPAIGRRTKNKKTTRQYKIDKNRTLYYRKYEKKLLIVYIFDDRRNPNANPYI